MIHIREPYVHSGTTRETAVEIPQDVLWLNRATTACAAIFGTLLLWLGVSAFLHLTAFSIRKLEVRGDTQFNNELTVRANVVPQLTGNYFSLNLRTAQQAFEALPWIHTAVVQRQFPNQLQVQLTAHVPVARWMDDDSAVNTDTERLLNTQGEVFEATGGSIDTDNLPELSGPTSAASDVLALFKSLQSALEGVQRKVVQLRLNPQGLWRAVLDNESQLELGSGSKADVIARVNRWLQAAPEVTKQYGTHDIQSVDLRYSNGFAIRLAGVTTRSNK